MEHIVKAEKGEKWKPIGQRKDIAITQRIHTKQVRGAKK